MSRWRSPSGQPLASAAWLEAHHRAKLAERRDFANRLASRNPRSIVDLGCGTGLWLELLNEVMPAGCEFIGVDIDPQALEVVERRAQGWGRSVHLAELDIGAVVDRLPAGDLTLAFNVFPYLADPVRLLEHIAGSGGAVAMRQYDGAALRFGPMRTDLRRSIDTALQIAVGGSEQFRHYDMDRAFAALRTSPFEQQEIGFELFSRVAPFPAEFIDYFEGTLAWTLDYVADDAASHLRSWLADETNWSRNGYWFEVDLVAVLS
jgi:SAM-dependent methyltransferase